MQAALTLERAFADVSRNRSALAAIVSVVLFQSLLLGLLFVATPRPLAGFAGTQSGLGLCVGAAAFGSIVHLQAALGAHMNVRAAFYREHAAAYYRAPIHVLALHLAGAPRLIGTSVLFSSVLYWIAPLRPTAASFGFFCLACIITAAFFATTAAALASLLPSPQVAQVVAGAGISILILFAGLFITQQRIPAGWIGLYYADPLSHALRALATNNFFCAGAGCPTIEVPGLGVVGQWAYLRAYLGIGANYESRYQFGELGFAASAVGVMALLAVLFTAFVRHERR